MGLNANLCSNYSILFLSYESSIFFFLSAFYSPRFELPPLPDDIKGDKRKMPLVCHFCGEVGHKAGIDFFINLINYFPTYVPFLMLPYSAMSKNPLRIKRHLSYTNRCYGTSSSKRSNQLETIGRGYVL